MQWTGCYVDYVGHCAVSRVSLVRGTVAVPWLLSQRRVCFLLLFYCNARDFVNSCRIHCEQ